MASLLLATVLLAAGCSDSGEADVPTAAETSPPPALSTRTVPLAEYDGLTEGTPIQRSPAGRQVSLLALAADGVALISTRDEVNPKHIDGIHLPAGQLKLSYPARAVEAIPGTERAVEDADLTERHALWTERLGPVKEGHVLLSTAKAPDWALRSYNRTTQEITTLARIPGNTRQGDREFGTPLVVGDRAVWSVFGQGESGAEVFSRPLDGSAPARREAQKVSATASDGQHLWYSVINLGTEGPGVDARIVRRDLASRTDDVVHELTMGLGEVPGALAAFDDTLVWSIAGSSPHLVVSDGEQILGEVPTDALSWRALHVGPGLIGFGDSPDAEARSEGRMWLLDRGRNVLVELGGSCCPRVLVAGPYVVWDDGNDYRRGTMRS